MLIDAILKTAIGIVIGFASALTYDEITKKIGTGKYANFKGYHLHHSLFGIVIFILTPIIANTYLQTALIIGIGIGVIIQHTLICGFVFITKNRS